MVNYGQRIDWEAIIRRIDDEKRTIKNVADIAWRMREDRREASTDCLEALKRIREKVDAITMAVLEIEVYLSGHEKAMKPSQFGQLIGRSKHTISRRVDTGEILTRGGYIPPEALRKYGVGPFSPWPKQPMPVKRRKSKG